MDQLKPSPANSCPLTPLTFLQRAAVVYGDCPSVIHDSTTFTWSQTYARCLRVASAISSLGIQRGAVISVVAPNIPAMYELQFAVPMAGCVLNNINTRLDARAVSTLLRHAESRAVFLDSRFRSLVLESISLFPPGRTQPPLLILIDNDDDNGDISGLNTYEDMVKKGNPEFHWVRPENEWDPMTLNYTSDSLINWSVPKQPVYLWTLPMFHSNGWSYTWGMAAVGGTNICLAKFDARVVYAAINRYKVSHMCGAPVVLNMLANHPRARPVEPPVELMMGGAPLPPAVVLRTESLGFRVSHGYGMTEVAGVVVSCAWKSKWNTFPAAERARLKARQGVRTLGLTEADVVDPESGESVKRDGLPHYMVPKTVVVMAELPKTATGKVQKFALRDIASQMGAVATASRM
ncbi:probable acyl-activating enzyme 6 [Phtheirospermum japonicum]|uniref:Probable acyl-activating enzyme 6 n=1 Tax=Phtheirospermum japonicum TaxID=374723 RepID=A0A830CS95_9LAMI|nr:probable acyl-activating enzyme 6 [Phtheirospermum japonicum]